MPLFQHDLIQKWPKGVRASDQREFLLAALRHLWAVQDDQDDPEGWKPVLQLMQQNTDGSCPFWARQLLYLPEGWTEGWSLQGNTTDPRPQDRKAKVRLL